jgi:hypothetical protein
MVCKMVILVQCNFTIKYKWIKCFLPCSNLKSLSRWERFYPLLKETDSDSTNWCLPKLVRIELRNFTSNTRDKHFMSMFATHLCFMKCFDHLSFIVYTENL